VTNDDTTDVTPDDAEAVRAGEIAAVSDEALENVAGGVTSGAMAGPSPHWPLPGAHGNP
jgi:hypothetical protein